MVFTGQMMAPGQHRMIEIASHWTFWRKRYVEGWACQGCGLLIFMKGDNVDLVTDKIKTFRDEHSGFMSIQCTMNRIHTTQGVCREAGLKLRVELFDWRMIKMNYGKKVIKQ